MPAPRPLRVLFFHTNLLVGGAETLRLAQLRYLDRARVEPFVAVQNMGSWRDEPLMVRELRALGVPLFDLGARDEHPYNVRALAGLARLVGRLEPHLLQTSMFVANAIGRAVALARPRLRVLTEEHNRYVWKRAHHVAVDRALAWRSQRILACSDAVAEFTAGQERIDRRRFVTLHNCVDPARLRRGRDRDAVRSGLGTPPDAWVVIGVGRLSPQKGFDRLVDAVARLPALGRPVELWVVGGNSGNERAELEARAARLSGPNAPKVRLLGLRDDVADLMAGADVFAHSARWEGFGIVLLEAMHAALPVVAFGVDGVPEVVADGETGLLAPPDDVAALAAALAALARDPARARALGDAGRRRLTERFTPERHLERLYQIYDEIFDEPPASLPSHVGRSGAGPRPSTR